MYIYAYICRSINICIYAHTFDVCFFTCTCVLGRFKAHAKRSDKLSKAMICTRTQKKNKR